MLHSDTLPSKREASSVSYDEALENYLGNCTWRSIFALMDYQDFNSSPVWIAKKLGVSTHDAAVALDGLVLLGLAERTADGFKPKQLQFIIPETEMTMETRMNRHSTYSEEVLNKLSPERKAAFRHASIASNRELVAKCCDEVSKAITKLREESEKLKIKDGIYNFTFTGVNVLENEEHNGGDQ